MQYSLILFDMDGTLYPNHEGFDEVYPRVALELAAAAEGTDAADTKSRFLARMAELERQLGGRPTWTLTLLWYYDVGFEDYEKAINQELAVEEMLHPDPRAVAAVEAVAARTSVALYTTNNDRVTERVLRHLGFSHLFPPARRFTLSCVGRLPRPRRQQLAHVKPGEEGFRHVLDRFGGQAETTLMVGDSPVSDLQPAARLGLGCYRVSCPNDLYRLPDWLESR